MLDAARDDVRRIAREEMASAMARKVVSPVETIGPYSPAIRLGGFLFLSGQIGLDPASGQLNNESIETETRQALDNMNYILQSEGLSEEYE